MPQALLLKGAEGIGKLNFALNIAQSLLCGQSIDSTAACQSCPACHWFNQQSHPDFHLIQPAVLSAIEDDKESEKKLTKQITIEQIRVLSDFASLSAHQGGQRVVLIYPAEAMNNNAANALLKILEEPPKQMLILLVSHKPQRLLPTIRSRCLAFPMPLPLLNVATSWLQLQNIAPSEIFLAQTGFSPLLAMRLAEEKQLTEQLQYFIREIAQPDKVDVFALAEYFKSIEPVKVINWLQQWCHDLAGCKLTGKTRYFIDHYDLINQLSKKIDIHRMFQYQSKLIVAKREALHPLNPKLLYESILLAYQQAMRGVA
ncbi:MAG: DNA polymerase III subunit delta' [Candidatus Nitrotoga sp.]